MKIDWKRKLMSRKFWVAVVGFVTALLIAFNVDGNAINGGDTIEQITGIITAGGILIAYILGESYVDGKHTASMVAMESLEGIELENASDGGGVFENENDDE